MRVAYRLHTCEKVILLSHVSVGELLHSKLSCASMQCNRNITNTMESPKKGHFGSNINSERLSSVERYLIIIASLSWYVLN